MWQDKFSAIWQTSREAAPLGASLGSTQSGSVTAHTTALHKLILLAGKYVIMGSPSTMFIDLVHALGLFSTCLGVRCDAPCVYKHICFLFCKGSVNTIILQKSDI